MAERRDDSILAAGRQQTQVGMVLGSQEHEAPVAEVCDRLRADVFSRWLRDDVLVHRRPGANLGTDQAG